jgi:hypothetical protein
MNKSFRELFIGAVSGNHDAVEEILMMYMPLINRCSKINGQVDEDCKQYIMMRIAIRIHEFVV